MNKSINKKMNKSINKNINKSEIDPIAYTMRVNDNNILKNSTSGGFFTPLSKYILEKNGIVFGVGYDEKLKVIHKKIDKNEKIKDVIGSKYVQSELGESLQAKCKNRKKQQ